MIIAEVGRLVQNLTLTEDAVKERRKRIQTREKENLKYSELIKINENFD